MKDFKEQAKEYIKQVYSSHREQDEEAWNNLINILFMCFEEMMSEHENKYHK